MTDTAETHDGTTTPTASVLTPYHGTPVVAAGIGIANASGGLHDAVAVDPVELEIGSTVHVVLKCVVRPPQYDPVDKDNLRGPLKLVNRLRAEDATFVDEGLVKDHLDAQRQRIEHVKSIEDQRAREEAGEVPLFGDDGEPQAVGAVLDAAYDAALGLAEDAEDDTAWRDQRRTELEAWTKDVLIVELRDEHEVTPPSSATKPELVDLMLDAEAAQRTGDGVPF